MKKLIYVAAAAMVSLALAGCGQNGGTNQTTTSGQAVTETTTQKKEVSLSEIHDAVKAAYGENYIPSMEMDTQYISDLFGVTEDMYEEAIAEGPMISVHVETFAAFKAKEGKADELEAALNSYHKDLTENMGMQYPMNLPKIQASKVVRHGDYIFFVMLGSPSEDAADEDEMLKSAEESNQLAVDAIDEFFKS